MPSMADEGPAGEFSVRSQTPKPSLQASFLPQARHNNIRQATSDDELKKFIMEANEAKRPVVVNYGAAWCHACKKMLPTFYNLSNEYSSPIFIYADVDKCTDSTKDVRFTPTFRFFRDGEKVDEFYGAGAQRLRDRVWMQA